MIKYIAFLMLLAIRIAYQPTNAQSTLTPFTSQVPEPATTTAVKPAKMISVNGHISKNKVILDWVVGENETADQFEVERSTDGKNFSMAALVFGTDRPDTGNYQFYEKAGNHKVSYRIKLINKNKQTEYSTIVEIVPNV